MRTLLTGISLTLFLAGCGLPPMLTVATTVADGFSYAVSGKGMTDHALSAVTTSDCAIFRVLDDRDICTDYDGEEMPRVLLASAPGVGSWASLENSVTSGSSFAGSAGSGVPVSRIAVSASTASVLSAAAGKVTVLASYRDPHNAATALERLASFEPRIIAANAGGHRVYRLVSDAPIQQALAAGIDDAWSVRPDSGVPAPL